MNSLLTYRGDLFVSVGATGEFWRYDGESWQLEYKLPKNQPWIGTTWGRVLWKEELWFGGLEARLKQNGVIIHYDGEDWEPIRPKIGPEIWDLTAKKALYALDSKQILKSENGKEWEVVSGIPRGEGRSIEILGQTVYVGTTEGLLRYDLVDAEWEEIERDLLCNDITRYSPVDSDWLIAGCANVPGGPYYIFDGENWHPVRIGNHVNEERIKLTSHGEGGRGGNPHLFIPQTAPRSGPFGGQTGLGRLFVTDWNDFNCIFEGSCAVTEAELYDGELYFGTAWNKSYETLQGTNASIFRISNIRKAMGRPALKHHLHVGETVQKNTTDAVFCAGYHRIWIGVEASEAVDLKIEIDPYGTFDWKTYEQLSIGSHEFTSITLSNIEVTMIRVTFETSPSSASVFVNLGS